VIPIPPNYGQYKIVTTRGLDTAFYVRLDGVDTWLTPDPVEVISWTVDNSAEAAITLQFLSIMKQYRLTGTIVKPNPAHPNDVYGRRGDAVVELMRDGEMVTVCHALSRDKFTVHQDCLMENDNSFLD
jgi:hypothetical protein